MRPLGCRDALSSERVEATPAFTSILVNKDISYLRYSISMVCMDCSVPFNSMRQPGMPDIACLNRAMCGCNEDCGTSCLAIRTRMFAPRAFDPAAVKDSSTNSCMSSSTSGHGPEKLSTYLLMSLLTIES
jgi:hypothetical protein